MKFEVWHVIAGFYLGLTMMAGHFGWAVLSGGSPIKPTTYGAAVYAIPAIVWVAAQMAGTLCGFIGAIYKNRVLMFIGGANCALVWGAFAVLGRQASDGILLVTSSLYVGVPAGVFTMVYAVSHDRTKP